MARPNVWRSQPLSASIGSWKKPIAERGPKVSAAIRQPQMMISHGTRPAGRWVAVIVAMLRASVEAH